MSVNLYNKIDTQFVNYPDGTHYTVSEVLGAQIRIYDHFGQDDIAPIETIERSLIVQCLEYHMGEAQEWAMIKIIDNDFETNKYYNEIVYIKIYDFRVGFGPEYVGNIPENV